MALSLLPMLASICANTISVSAIRISARSAKLRPQQSLFFLHPVRADDGQGIDQRLIAGLLNRIPIGGHIIALQIAAQNIQQTLAIDIQRTNIGD